MSRVVPFDVNDTLLDTGALDELFSDLFGTVDAPVQWFQYLKEFFRSER